MTDPSAREFAEAAEWDLDSNGAYWWTADDRAFYTPKDLAGWPGVGIVEAELSRRGMEMTIDFAIDGRPDDASVAVRVHSGWWLCEAIATNPDHGQAACEAALEAGIAALRAQPAPSDIPPPLAKLDAAVRLYTTDAEYAEWQGSHQ